MARARDPNRDKAFEIYKKHNGKIDLVEIASQLGIPDGTVRGWKSKDKWDKKLGIEKNGTERKERNVPKEEQNVTKETADIAIKSVMENEDLTDKQRLFCLYYSRSFNATQSYKKAYGCSYDTAWKNSSTLMANQGIRDEIAKLKEQRYAKALLKPEDIFQKYMDIAFSDVTDYVEFGKRDVLVGELADGTKMYQVENYVEINESNQVDGSLITEVSKGKDGIKIKLADKMKALDWLTEHMEMATEKQKAELALIKKRADIGKTADTSLMEALLNLVGDNK